MARHQFAVLSLVVIALASSFWFLVDVLGAAAQRSQAFGVAAFESRFAPLRQAVQAPLVLGYVCDSPPNDPSALAEFHVTQYTLAPAIIKPSATQNLVVVNYHQKQLDPKMVQASHLAIIQDFGNGAALCRRTP